MTYQFKKAVRSDTSVLIALAGPSGGGKTMSGMKLAKGLAGDKKWVVLDTEAGRATHYASMFDFDVLDMKPPFSPQAYYEAIVAAEDAGYSVIFIDSATHEWSGDGGCTDIHDEALERMSKGDPARAERMSALAWRDAKMQHKRFMSRLLQCRAHLIFGLRAEDKIKFSKVNENGREKTVIEHIGFQPICEKSFMFEMSASFLLTPDAPGVPKPIKLPEILKSCFPLDRPIDEEAGRRVAAWAAGATEKTDKPDTAAIAKAFKELGWESDAIDKTVGKPIAEWTPADVAIARQAYRKATAQKAATI